MAGSSPLQLIAPAEADALLARHAPSWARERVGLSEAAGRVLAEPVAADRPFPPYDRVMLDGFALRAGEALAGTRTFTVAAFQPAGRPPLSLPDGPALCIEVATGAVLPAGADCVVPYEFASRDGDRILLAAGEMPAAGDAVHACESDRRAGEVLLTPGLRLGGRELAVAASCGYTALCVAARPVVGVLTTGDELCAPGAHPEPWQQRRSNDQALAATLAAAGAARVEFDHASDEPEAVLASLQRLLSSCACVLVTGGVSRGRLDLIPEALAKAGARKVFHGVAQRPGKPLWFGVAGNVPVFGLPGNPVSTYTCLHRYVLPMLARAAGEAAGRALSVSLAAPVKREARLTQFVPVLLETGEDARLCAKTKRPGNSGDLAGLLGSDGFVEIAAGVGEAPAGFLAPYRPWV